MGTFVRCMNLMKVCTGVWMFNGLVTTHVSECGIDIQDAGLVSSHTSEFVWFNDCVQDSKTDLSGGMNEDSGN